MECLWDEEKKIIRISDSKKALLWFPFKENAIFLNILEFYQFIKQKYMETKKNNPEKELTILLAYPYQDFELDGCFSIYIYSDYYNEIFISELYIYLKEILKSEIIFNNVNDTLPIRFYHEYIRRNFALVDNFLNQNYHAITHFSLYNIGKEEFKELNDKFNLENSSNSKLNVNNLILSTMDIFSYAEKYYEDERKAHNKKIEEARIDIYNFLFNPNDPKYSDIKTKYKKTDKDEALAKNIISSIEEMSKLDLVCYFILLKFYWGIYENNALLHQIQKNNSLILSTAIHQIIENVFHHTQKRTLYMFLQYLHFYDGDNEETQLRYLNRKDNLIDLLIANKDKQKDKRVIENIKNVFQNINGGVLIYLQDVSDKGISKTSKKSIRAFTDFDTAISDEEGKTFHYGLKFMKSIIEKLNGFFMVSSDQESILRFKKNDDDTVGDINIYWDTKEEKQLIGTKYIIFVPAPLLMASND